MVGERTLGGRYAVSGRLGRGGMAEVHLAHDQRLDRMVAIKVLRPDLAADNEYLARFRREVLSAASLNHPSIVAVYDSGEDNVGGVLLPYLVMELVRGATLAELLLDEAPLTVRRSLELTAGVLEALAHAHAAGIVHRDIKPANVMLDDDGTVKVMDFGIARPLGSDSGMTLTRTSMVIGTAEYLSPEQARGQTVDARTDLYSTGCLLYELLTGRPPFVGEGPLDVAVQHLRNRPEPPSVHASASTRGCDALVLRALEKDPERRFGSAAEMWDALEAVHRSLEVLDPATGRGAAVQPVHEQLPGAPGSRRPHRARRGRLLVPLVAVAALLAGGGAYAVTRGTTTGSRGVAAAQQVRTPPLTGKTLAEARVLARIAGLHVSMATTGGCSAPAVAPHRICRQQPDPGSTVARGSDVRVLLAPVGGQ